MSDRSGSGAGGPGEPAARADGRGPTDLRPISFVPGFQAYAEGSVLISCGQTKVLCSASAEPDVPRWLRGAGRGWVSAEYSMLPRATHERTARESQRGKVGGRTHEIQRLIGRSLRAAIDLEALGEQMIQLDCDVLQADGGTRTAAITGAWVALSLALDNLVERGVLPARPRLRPLAAVSVGIVDGRPVLDLDYAEDSRAETDMNVVVAGSEDGGGELSFVEVQGTAERATFSRAELDALLELAADGCTRLMQAQAAALAEAR